MADDGCGALIAEGAATGCAADAGELDAAMLLGCCSAAGDAAGADGTIASGPMGGGEYELRSQAARQRVEAKTAQMNLRFIYPSTSRTLDGVLASILVRFVIGCVEREFVIETLIRSAAMDVETGDVSVAWFPVSTARTGSD